MVLALTLIFAISLEKLTETVSPSHFFLSFKYFKPLTRSLLAKTVTINRAIAFMQVIWIVLIDFAPKHFSL